MTDPTPSTPQDTANSAPTGPSTGPSIGQAGGKSPLAKTIGFVVVVGGVLGLFAYLGSQGGAIPMPSNRPDVALDHQLRINVKGELIGLESDPPVDKAAVGPAGFKFDKKAAEKAVNVRCAACHAVLPPHHPPKPECIKCHREAPRTAPAGASSAIAPPTGQPMQPVMQGGPAVAPAVAQPSALAPSGLAPALPAEALPAEALPEEALPAEALPPQAPPQPPAAAGR